jgi:hypothetical protein
MGERKINPERLFTRAPAPIEHSAAVQTIEGLRLWPLFVLPQQLKSLLNLGRGVW